MLAAEHDGGDALRVELVGYVLGVGNGHAPCDSGNTWTDLAVLVDCITDKFRLIDYRRQLFGVVVAHAFFDAGQVNLLSRGVDHRTHQKPAFNKLADRDAGDHVFVDAAVFLSERLVVQSARGAGNAQHFRVREAFKHFAV